MNSKFFHAAMVAAFLARNLGGASAQTAPASPPVLPTPGAAMMQSGREVQGFQFVSGEPSVMTHTVKGAPYSLDATIKTAQTLADGNRIVHRQTVHLYRDSKGRTRREETLVAIGPWGASGAPPTMITIQDPVSRASYFLDPQRKTATKIPAAPIGKGIMVTGGMISAETGSGPVTASMGSAAGGISVSSDREGPAPETGFHIESSGQAMHLEEKSESSGKDSIVGISADGTRTTTTLKEKSESLGKDSIVGISADGTRTTTTIPANAMGNERPIDIVRERWYSPDLQIVLRSKQTDPRFGETAYEVTKLDRGEPASSIFDVPSDYKILKADAPVTIKHDNSR